MKWIVLVVLSVGMLPGCTMFESSQRTKAMADGVTGISQEYGSVADAFDAQLTQLISKNSTNPAAVQSLTNIKAQVQASRTRVAALQSDLMNVINTSGLDADVKVQLIDVLVSLKKNNQK